MSIQSGRDRLSVPRAVAIATAFGVVAVGACAIGALAIRRLAIRTLVVDRAEFKSFAIADLTVTRLHAGDVTITDSLAVPDSGARRR